MKIAFVPLRGGSKGIPEKNIKILHGKPLAYWCLKMLEDCKEVDKTIVATDCDEIGRIIKSFELKKVKIYNRKEENAQDKSSTESVILEYISSQKLNPKDTFILVQATSPFTKSEDISKALKMYESKKYDSILSCSRLKRFLWNINGSTINYDYSKRPRRQDFNGTLVENGALYISSIEKILKYKNRLSGKIGIYEMEEYTSLEIDEYDDWNKAEEIMNKIFPTRSIDPNLDIKLVASDVDGVLTDCGMYYDNKSSEVKKFNTRDGMGFQILKEIGIKTAIVTSETTDIVKRRAKKLKIDYLFMGVSKKEKLEAVKKITSELKITLKNVAYIGDDINCKDLLDSVGLAACPSDAHFTIKKINAIKILKKRGGNGAFREFADIIHDIQKPH